MNRIMKFFGLLVAVLTLAACAGPGVYVSSTYVFKGGVAKLGAGREAAVIEMCKLAKKATPEEQDELRKNPDSAVCAEQTAQYALGTTVERDIVTAATPIVAGAVVQGEYGKVLINEQAKKVCLGGKCGSGANAGASANSAVTVNLGCNGATCGN